MSESDGTTPDTKRKKVCNRCRVGEIDGGGWPADDGPLCQDCWEADCARSFWSALNG